MNRIDLKQVVSSAIASEWERFAERHPALARAVDRQVIVEQCMTNLRQEPEFVDAMQQVQMHGLAHDVLQALAVKLVRGWMRLL